MLVTSVGAATQEVVGPVAAALGLEVVPLLPGQAIPAGASLAVVAQDDVSSASLIEAVGKLGELASVAIVGPITRAVYGHLVGRTSVCGVVADSSADLAARLRTLLGELTGPQRAASMPTDSLVLHVSSSPAIQAATETVSTWCRSAGVRRRIHAAVIDICDELLSNAIYNAPIDAQGARPYQARSRREAVELEPEHGAKLSVWVAGGQVTVSCVDPFGSLPEARARAFIAKGMTRASGQVSSKAGGAGLGLARVVELADLCEVRVTRRRRTELRVTLDLHRRRSWSSEAPSLLLVFR